VSDLSRDLASREYNRQLLPLDMLQLINIATRLPVKVAAHGGLTDSHRVAPVLRPDIWDNSSSGRFRARSAVMAAATKCSTRSRAAPFAKMARCSQRISQNEAAMTGVKDGPTTTARSGRTQPKYSPRPSPPKLKNHDGDCQDIAYELAVRFEASRHRYFKAPAARHGIDCFMFRLLPGGRTRFRLWGWDARSPGRKIDETRD
jgi:hypothetical protein